MYVLVYIQYNSQHGGGRGSGDGSHYNNGRCEIFVSRLQPSTSARDVIIILKPKFSRNFRVEQLLQTKYNHYACFKVTLPITCKKDLLNKDNWDDNHVFVKSFVKRPSLVFKNMTFSRVNFVFYATCFI